MLEPSYGGRRRPHPRQDRVWFDPKTTLERHLRRHRPRLRPPRQRRGSAREALRLPSGATVWQVPVRSRVEDDDWVLLWFPDGDDAVIAYVGSRMFR